MPLVIKNSDALSQTPARRDALAIAKAGYAAADIRNTIAEKIHLEDGKLRIDEKIYDLASRNVFFVGIGKCAAQGGRALEAILGDALMSGIALDVAPTLETPSKIETLVGTHPLPSEANVRASERILQFLSGKSAEDLVIMLVSGGGSTLLCLPEAPMTHADESTLFTELTARGAPIDELNIVRKHTSHARGGALAVAAHPAEVVSLIVSDVPGDDLATIASGPTILDSSTAEDAKAVLAKYSVEPTNIALRETEKDSNYFARVTNTLLLSSQDALGAMSEEAARRGYAARIVDTHFSGEAREVGYAIALELHKSTPKTALLYAGESTVALGEKWGAGGRNQEMALGALADLQRNELILPFASDGHDNTPHAGAFADELARTHAEDKGLAAALYLEEHRSYDFFVETGDAIVTEPVASNVSDLVVALKGE